MSNIKRKQEYKRQVALSDELQDKGYNIVTCGNCGCVLLHRINASVIKCFQCGQAFEPCDCPDYFYEYYE